MIIRVIRGRLREKNLRHLRNLREKENQWDTKKKVLNICEIKLFLVILSRKFMAVKFTAIKKRIKFKIAQRVYEEVLR